MEIMKQKLTKSEQQACTSILEILSKSNDFRSSKYLQRKVGSAYYVALTYIVTQELIEPDANSAKFATDIINAAIKDDVDTLNKLLPKIKYKITYRGRDVLQKLKEPV